MDSVESGTENRIGSRYEGLRIDNGNSLFIHTKNIEKGMRLAKAASSMSDFSRSRLGAVLMYKGKVVSVGWNSTKTSPVQKRVNVERGYDVESSTCSLHAEISCLNRAKAWYREEYRDWTDEEFSRMKMFVWREKKENIEGRVVSKAGLAKPCKACMRALREAGIREVWWSSGD